MTFAFYRDVRRREVGWIGILLFINYVSMYHRISPILTPAAVGDEGGVGQPRQVEARWGRQESPCR